MADRVDLKVLEDQLPLHTPQARRAPRRKWVALTLLALAGYAFMGTLNTFMPGDETPSSEELRAFRAAKSIATTALTQEEREQLFLSVPNPKSALAASREYATHPHLASSTEDFEDSKVMLKLFQDNFGIRAPKEEPIFSAGTDESRAATLGINRLKGPAAWVDTYYPFMNTPKDRSLQILGHHGESIWDADLVEDGDPLDPEAAKYKDYIPTWHGLSRDGVAEGEIIYVNYGTKEDYDTLVAKGTNFTGKIVLARYYGDIFRGLKILGAQNLGAVGALIYSDPRDDGSVTVENGFEPYPAGPARNPTAVQRGSVQFLSLYPGDPTTPGYPAYENATRTEGENIPKIPSLPISWANARRLLGEIVSVEEEALTLSGKHSERKIRLVNHVDDHVMPIYNTMAAIPGHIKGETVVIGCHRDAWVMGAADPTSGTVSLHEVIKGFGTLLRTGWKPLRNIVIASWDAEEYGLVGSTEWVEDFSDWISSNVVAYINLDVSVAGSRWNAAASPSLAHVIQQAALDVPHPTDPLRTLWDAKQDVGPFTGPQDEAFVATYKAEQLRKATDTGIPPLGSGSDFTAFLQRLGIASMDQGFGPTPWDAPYHYHSIYDSQRWQEVYADPGFLRHVAVAKHLGLVALRLTDSIILPLNTTQYAQELDDYLDKIVELADASAMKVNFAGLRFVIGQVQEASQKLDKEKVAAGEAFQKLVDKLPETPGDKMSFIWKLIYRWIKHRQSPIKEFVEAAKRVGRANAKLVAFEKGFLHEDGIKDREWYKHLGVAPGKWLGYGATTLPALYDAIVFDKNTTLVEAEVERLTNALIGLAAELTPTE